MFAVDVHPALAVGVEGLADRRVVQPGVGGGHGRAGVTQKTLDHMFGDTLVDQPCADRMAPLVGAHPDRPARLVVQADGLLPTAEASPQGGVLEGAGTVGVRLGGGEQPR